MICDSAYGFSDKLGGSSEGEKPTAGSKSIEKQEALVDLPNYFWITGFSPNEIPQQALSHA